MAINADMSYEQFDQRLIFPRQIHLNEVGPSRQNEHLLYSRKTCLQSSDIWSNRLEHTSAMIKSHIISFLQHYGLFLAYLAAILKKGVPWYISFLYTLTYICSKCDAFIVKCTVVILNSPTDMKYCPFTICRDVDVKKISLVTCQRA